MYEIISFYNRSVYQSRNRRVFVFYADNFVKRFTGKQAEPGLILFIVWVLLTSFIAGILSFLSAGYLTNAKSLNQWLAALIGITVFTIVGAAINFVGIFVAVSLVSAMR